jgi:hypothetical protein
MFGGWKTVWHQGYNVAPQPYLAHDQATGTYTLTFPAHVPYPDLPIREYRLRVVLPEAAVVTGMSAPFPHTRGDSRRFTYLDGPSFGRPIVEAVSDGVVVSSGGYTGDVVVTFTVPAGAVLYKPGYLIAAFFAVFVGCTVLSRLPLGLPSAPGAAPIADDKKRQ